LSPPDASGSPVAIAALPVVEWELVSVVLEDEQAVSKLTAASAPRIPRFIRMHLCQTLQADLSSARRSAPGRAGQRD
jgi:hypothetical protein